MDVVHLHIRKTAFPRTGRGLDAMQGTGSVSSVSSSGGGGGPSYWSLVNTDAEGNPVEEGKEYIMAEYTAVSQKDVIAFGADPEITDIGFPIASYTSLGAVSIKQGGGLVIDGNGMVSIDPNSTGGGLDENALQEYLTERHYLTPTGLLYGYVQNTENPLITASDSVNAAFKKLENKLLSIDGDYVTLTTDQTITGQKTFEKTVISKADVVAYAAGSIEDLAAIATTTTYGLIKYDGSVFTTNASGQLTLTDGAGGGLTNVVSSGSGNAVTDLSYNKETKVLTWTKGSIFALRSEIPTVPTAIKNPYSLSWSGYSSGSYDGSSAKSISIPNNTNQLTNGAGFIKDGNGNFTTLSGSGSSSKYLAGNGTFYTISYSEISGTPNLSVYMPIAGGTFTGVVNMNNGTTFPYYRVTNSVGWAQLAGTSGTYLGSTVSGIIQSSLGFAIMGRNSSPNMVVFDGGTMKASADVVAYASSSSISDIVAIATSTSYGVVKYDGDTIRVNSSGQLYVASGGGSGSSVSWGTNSTYSIPLTVDGVTYTLEKLGYTAWGTNSTYSVGLRVGHDTYTLSKDNIVAWGINSSYYVNLNVKGTSYVLAKNNFASWGNTSNNTSSLTVNGTSKTVSLSSHTHSLSVSTTGSGNVVTGISANGLSISVTKGNVSGGGESSPFTEKSIGNLVGLFPDQSSKRYVLSGVLNRSGGEYWQHIWGESSSYNFVLGGLKYNTTTTYSIFSISRSSSYASTVSVSVNGTISQSSDIRLKDITGGFHIALNDIMTVDAYRFFWKSDVERSQENVGLIAQHLLGHDKFRYFVNYHLDENGEKYYSIDYSTLGAIVSIQGLKELYQKHQSLENLVKSRQHWELTKDEQIKHLQDTVIRLQNEINELKGEAA